MEDSIKEEYEHKKLHYAELAARQHGWNTKAYPVKEGRRGFGTSSIVGMVKEVGLHGQAVWQTIRLVSQAAERSYRWIWLKQKDAYWTPRTSS